MSKPRRNKALAVLDGRIACAQQALELAMARQNELNGTLNSLTEAREQVAKAYERKGAGRPARPSAHAKAVKILDDAAAKAIRERAARQANDLSEPGQVNDATRQRAQAVATETPL